MSWDQHNCCSVTCTEVYPSRKVIQHKTQVNLIDGLIHCHLLWIVNLQMSLPGNMSPNYFPLPYIAVTSCYFLHPDPQTIQCCYSGLILSSILVNHSGTSQLRWQQFLISVPGSNNSLVQQLPEWPLRGSGAWGHGGTWKSDVRCAAQGTACTLFPNLGAAYIT